MLSARLVSNFPGKWLVATLRRPEISHREFLWRLRPSAPRRAPSGECVLR
jgi:hypothetical protein